jgi:hypothetical protein
LDIEAGSFVAFYTGQWFESNTFDRLPPQQRESRARFAVEVPEHDVTLSPEVGATGVDFERHPSAAMNEPPLNGPQLANVFISAHVTDLQSAYLSIGVFTCRRVPANTELLWNYGDTYERVRQRMGYRAAAGCPDSLTRGIDVRSELNERVATLLRGRRRTNDVLYTIPVSSDGPDSDNDWTPATAVVRRPPRPRRSQSGALHD